MVKHVRLIRATIALGVVVSAFCSNGCGPYWNYRDPLRGAYPVQLDSYGDAVDKVVYLDQGWSPRDSIWYYTTTQGSRFMPYRWFLALEQPDNSQPFRAESYIRRFRFLPERPSKPNPDGLPMGFVRDGHSRWLGFTCSACHSNQVNYKGTGIRVDGAPTLADFDAFQAKVAEAIQKTLPGPGAQDSPKFERFAVAVLGSDYSPERKAGLRTRVEKFRDAQIEYRRRNHSSTPYGYARIDAFGRIYNRVLYQVKAGPDNFNPPDAPVSYPFLWDTPMHDYVQWVGVASNANVGSLGRNVGEVLGVFGEFNMKQPKLPVIGYKSSVQGMNLVDLEETIRKLESPKWPEGILPPLDKDLVKRGKELYAEHCLSCHHHIDRSDPDRQVRAQMYKLSLIKTDPKTAKNIVNYRGKTGLLEGTKELIYKGPVFNAEAFVSNMVTNAGAGVLEHKAFDAARAEIISIRRGTGGRPPKKEGEYNCDTKKNPSASLLAYKARPLNGIWATAPYLHNGSVPNLYELLLPPAKRSKRFWVGRREFDPVKVGFVDKGYVPGFGSEFDTSLPGNSNEGHEYGIELGEKDRMALVEYQKSL